jgi:hypothetical protein
MLKTILCLEWYEKSICVENSHIQEDINVKTRKRLVRQRIFNFKNIALSNSISYLLIRQIGKVRKVEG